MAREKRRAPREGEIERAIPIRWEIPDEMDIAWASHCVVQHSQREFILNFFQVTPPILIQPTEEELKSLRSVRGKAVARIAISPAALKELIEVLETNLKSFLQGLEQEKSKG
ncbi:MAG: DUF3467 domain-containing protein [Anaerolineae bacterium]|jgi:hypothetical protein|nr:DUF3467 domain-containing protein [Anaerolineae bacterium]